MVYDSFIETTLPPFMVPGLVLSILFDFWFIGMGLRREWQKSTRVWRQANGLCQACGYDLRASPERCPECGTPKA